MGSAPGDLQILLCAPTKVLKTVNKDEDSFSPVEDEDGNGSESLLDDNAPLGSSALEMDIEQENNEQEWDSPMEEEPVISPQFDVL